MVGAWTLMSTSPTLLATPISSSSTSSRPPNQNVTEILCLFQNKQTILRSHVFHSKSISPFPTSKSNSYHVKSPIAKASVASEEFVTEPGTNVKFATNLSVPGCSDSLVLLGKGFREKVFAIIGVKVYAVGLYVNKSLIEKLTAWQGKSALEIQMDSALFNAVFEAPAEKVLKIVLVRDVDGKTFWDALNEAISPRIKDPTDDDKSALSTFRNTFQGRPLKQGTVLFLTWVEPSKMLICISSNGLPIAVDASIESINVTSALFDVFLGNAPVSPSLKGSVAEGISVLLK